MELHDASLAVAIPVKDLEAIRRFDVLQLPLEAEEEAGIYHRSGDSLIGLHQTPSGGSAQHTLGGWDVEDLPATMEALRARGVVFEEYDFPGLKTEKGIAARERTVGLVQGS
jgi:hypothetical protein